MPVASLYPDRYRDLTVRLRRARHDAGLSQEAVAKKLGVPQKFISKVELGERRIDPVELAALASLYGKPLSFFFE